MARARREPRRGRRARGAPGFRSGGIPRRRRRFGFRFGKTKRAANVRRSSKDPNPGRVRRVRVRGRRRGRVGAVRVGVVRVAVGGRRIVVSVRGLEARRRRGSPPPHARRPATREGVRLRSLLRSLPLGRRNRDRLQKRRRVPGGRRRRLRSPRRVFSLAPRRARVAPRRRPGGVRFRFPRRVSAVSGGFRGRPPRRALGRDHLRHGGGRGRGGEGRDALEKRGRPRRARGLPRGRGGRTRGRGRRVQGRGRRRRSRVFSGWRIVGEPVGEPVGRPPRPPRPRRGRARGANVASARAPERSRRGSRLRRA